MSSSAGSLKFIKTPARIMLGAWAGPVSRLFFVFICLFIFMRSPTLRINGDKGRKDGSRGSITRGRRARLKLKKAYAEIKRDLYTRSGLDLSGTGPALTAPFMRYFIMHWPIISSRVVGQDTEDNVAGSRALENDSVVCVFFLMKYIHY